MFHCFPRNYQPVNNPQNNHGNRADRNRVNIFNGIGNVARWLFPNGRAERRHANNVAHMRLTPEAQDDRPLLADEARMNARNLVEHQAVREAVRDNNPVMLPVPLHVRFANRLAEYLDDLDDDLVNLRDNLLAELDEPADQDDLANRLANELDDLDRRLANLGAGFVNALANDDDFDDLAARLDDMAARLADLRADFLAVPDDLDDLRAPVGDVHNAELIHSETGYPRLFRVLNSKVNQAKAKDAAQINADIKTTAIHWVQLAKMDEAAERKVSAAVDFMLSSFSANGSIIDYPADIFLSEILSKTWCYLMDSTEENPSKREEAIGALFGQLEDAAGTCNAGHASRVLQSLCITFPEQFPEPMTFAHARDFLQAFSKQLIQNIVADKSIPPTAVGDNLVQLSDVETHAVKAEFLNCFQESVKASMPNINDQFIRQFINEFVETAFESLVELALSARHNA